jgi:hemoglobin-like flavoprotein
MDTSLITRSLELVAERGDPVSAVYAHLFAKHPEMESLFVRDTTGIVRGSMLTEALTALLDFADGDRYGGNLMRAEIVNHENLGVPREVFAAFYSTTSTLHGTNCSPELVGTLAVRCDSSTLGTPAGQR